MTASKLSEPDEQGFVTVQTIKYKTPSQNPAQKSKKNRKNRRPIPEESVSIRLANLAKRLDAHKLSLASGPWGQAWTALPDDPSGPFQPSSPLKKAKSILCLGLGSLETSRIAQCQLALMLDLSDRLQITSMEAYDPAFTDLDRSLLESYSIKVLTDNLHGCHPLDGAEPTLIYMPHCPRTLYQNILSTNWNPSTLSGLTLLANDLSGYVVREPQKKLESCAPCLPLITPHLSIHLLPKNYPPNDVFNDLAFQYLTPDAILQLGTGAQGWNPPIAKPDEGQGRDEMI